MSEIRTAGAVQPAWRRWLAFGVLTLAVLLFTIDHLSVNVALSTIQQDLGATIGQLAWVVGAFTLALAGLLMLAAGLGDRFGRRVLLLLGLAVFAGASALATWAESPLTLILARYGMGAGAALVLPNALGTIRNIFPAKQRATALGLWSAVGGVGLALGPLAGGWLLSDFWWGSIFLINLPVVLVLALGVLLLVPETRDPAPRRLDLIGAVTAALSVSALVWGLIEAPERGWGNHLILGAFGASLVLAVVWVLWERHSNHPMVELRWFRDRRFSAGSGAIAASYIGVVGTLFALALWLQDVKGYTPYEAGLRIAPVAVAVILVAPMAGIISHRRGPRWVVAGGGALVTTGLVLFSQTSAETPYRSVLLALLLGGAGMGAVIAPSQASVLEAIDDKLASAGSALADSARYLGATLGVAGVSTVFSSRYASEVEPSLRGLPPTEHELAEESVVAAAQIAQRLGGEAGAALRSAAFDAFSSGLERAVLAAAAAALLGSVLALWLPPLEARGPAVLRIAFRRLSNADLRRLAFHARAQRRLLRMAVGSSLLSYIEMAKERAAEAVRHKRLGQVRDLKATEVVVKHLEDDELRDELVRLDELASKRAALQELSPPGWVRLERLEKTAGRQRKLVLAEIEKRKAISTGAVVAPAVVTADAPAAEVPAEPTSAEPAVVRECRLGHVRALRVEGAGPPIVFVAGWRRGADDYRPLLGWFAERGHAAVAVDLPGLGAPPRRGPLLDQCLDDLDVVIGAIGGPLVLYGHSTGATVVAIHSAERPDPRVGRLVLDAPLGLIWPPKVERDLRDARRAVRMPGWLTIRRRRRVAARWSSEAGSTEITAADVRAQAQIIMRFARDLRGRFLPANISTERVLWLYRAKDRIAPLEGFLALPERHGWRTEMHNWPHETRDRDRISILCEAFLSFAGGQDEL